MLRVTHDDHPILRRPFSLYRTFPGRGTEKRRRKRFAIIYKRVGLGTQKMTELRKGDSVGLIGPLGNGFTLPPLPSSDKVVLIGGGVGIVTLYPLAETLRAKEFTVLIGGKTKQDILCSDDFRRLTPNVFVATEDGSLGFRGTALDLFRSRADRTNKNETVYLYTCGPMAMLRSLSQQVRSKRFLCQASLESRMACGFGACLGCAVKTRDATNPYHRVCKEGPVFLLNEILWE